MISPPNPALSDSKAVTQRRDAIVELVSQRGFMSVDVLATRFGVTPQTIRRDVNSLYAAGRLSRFHGGAGVASSGRNVGYSARQVLQHDAKRRIGRAIAARIPDGASLFLTIGTTTEEVARALCGHRNLRVVTNNLNVANLLIQSGECEVIIAGGLVRNHDGGLVGEATLDLINQFRVDFGIIGISGIDLDGTLLEYDTREVRITQAIQRNARRVLLGADHTKFGRPAMVHVGTLADVAVLFTDVAPPEPVAELMRREGVELCLATS